MKASIAIQVLPAVDSEDELIRIVDEVIAYIKSSGLNCYVGPFETTVEGESYDQLMEIAANCQKVAIKAGCESVSAYIKVVYSPEGEVLTIDKKVSKHHQ
ncbi:MAG: thiamine-binding protein [Clostridia bacterium]|nr:thiamine-binding protein [Clostridia bacterium]